MAGGLVGPRIRRYRAKSWKKMYTVNGQPWKLEIGTPKYPPPCVQIHVWLMVEAIGSRERSQATIMNDATNGTATVVKTLLGDLQIIQSGDSKSAKRILQRRPS